MVTDTEIEQAFDAVMSIKDSDPSTWIVVGDLLNKLKKERNESRVQFVSEFHAGPVHLSACRVIDPKTGSWSKVQFQMTYGETTCAVMGTEAAKLFTRFVAETLKNQASVDSNADLDHTDNSV